MAAAAALNGRRRFVGWRAIADKRLHDGQGALQWVLRRGLCARLSLIDRSLPYPAFVDFRFTLRR
ncbi:hypothetical protein C3497_06770 [Zoogloeaceae bacteirum Par-f-2]|nr:hypothetical protein C3497_06770 [Zoogloeaceae bacteirum Par-f-2]